MIFSAVTAALVVQAWAAPAPARLQPRQSNGGEVGGAVAAEPTQSAYGPPGSSGSLRGKQDLRGYHPANPVATQDSSVVPTDDFELAPGQTDDADLGLYLDLSTVENPQPIRGGSGNKPTDPGPRNTPLDRQNSDIFAPPGTDSGDTPQAKWPLALSHNRHGLKGAGWARQQ